MSEAIDANKVYPLPEFCRLVGVPDTESISDRFPHLTIYEHYEEQGFYVFGYDFHVWIKRMCQQNVAVGPVNWLMQPATPASEPKTAVFTTSAELANADFGPCTADDIY